MGFIDTVQVFHSRTKWAGRPGIIQDHTAHCRPFSYVWMPTQAADVTAEQSFWYAAPLVIIMSDFFIFFFTSYPWMLVQLVADRRPAV